MKNIEIERKFLITEENIPDVSLFVYGDTTQGYIQNIGSSYLYRLRQIIYMSKNNYCLGEQYLQTIKGFGTKKREEFEIELLKPQFSVLWPLCNNLIVHKFRYEIPIEGTKRHIDFDIYKNNLKGLYTAEVEFDTEEECDAFEPPAWFGMELTHDPRYSNFQLAVNGLVIN